MRRVAGRERPGALGIGCGSARARMRASGPLTKEHAIPIAGPGLLFCVSGPSGAGKDTLVDALRERMPRLRYSVSATTRPAREGEEEGVAYFFLKRAEFEARLHGGHFLETREYNGNLYGTPRPFIEQTLADGYDLIMKPEVNGALAIKSAFADAVLIFLLPDKFSHLRARLEARRTETNQEIAARLAIAHEELGYIRRFDYVVINEQQAPAAAVDDLAAIVRSEKLKINRYDDTVIRKLEES